MLNSINVLPVYNHVTPLSGNSISVTYYDKVIKFFCNHRVISHDSRSEFAERKVCYICAAENLSFKQHNKQFTNHSKYSKSKCPPPAFTRALNQSLSEVFNSLVASYLRSLEHLLDFNFGENLR